MRVLAMWIGLALLLAVSTALAGWWAVPIVSAAFTLALPRRGGVMIAAFSGAAAWGLLLMLAGRDGPVGDVDRVLSGTLQLPPGGGMLLTVLFAAVLAGAAALVAQAIRVPQRTRGPDVSSLSPSR